MKTMETHHDQGYVDFLDTAIYIENPQNYIINRGAKAAIQNRFLGILSIGLHDTYPCPLYLVHPMTVKKVFTGDGRANKDKMVKVAKAMLAPNSIKRSKLDRETIADSIAIAITGMKHQLGKVKAEAV